MNISKEWFWQQHYTEDELKTLQDWIDEKGRFVTVEQVSDRWSGFHVSDKEKKIDIAGQTSKEDCENWMKRLNLIVYTPNK